MAYDLSVIAGNPVLLALAVLCALSAIAFFVLARRAGLADWSVGRVRIGFGWWLALFSLPFWSLGPYSFISWDFDGFFMVPVFQWFSAHPGVFAHAVSGGIDMDLVAPGRQHLQPEIVLAGLLPTWIWILLHKAMVAALGFWGAFLLARRLLPDHPGLAAAAALPFPLAHTYLLNYSVEFGTGFAVIPLAVWVALAPETGWRYWARIAAVGVLVAFAEPMKVFPPLAVALVGAAILLGSHDIRRIALVLVLWVALTLANWHDVLLGLVVLSPFTSRMSDPFGGVGSSGPAALLGVWGMLRDVWPSTMVLAASLVALLVRDRRMALRLMAAMLWFTAIFVVLVMVPWGGIGLGFVEKLSHGYNRLALPSLAVLAAAAALAASLRRSPQAGRNAAAAAAAFGLSLLSWELGVDASQFVWLGGQSAFFGHENLKDPSWRPAEDFRVITLLDSPAAAAIPVFYGLDSFDGVNNLDPSPYARYWRRILHWDNDLFRWSRVRLDWQYWNGTAYELARQADLDLLGIANVRFVISPLPLAAEGLRLVRAPREARDRLGYTRRDFFPSGTAFIADRLRRIVAPGDRWIYELEAVLPRLYPAAGLAVMDDSLSDADFLGKVAEVTSHRIVVVRAGDAALLGGDARDFAVTGWRQRDDGYDVTVDAPDGGILVVNNYSLPFWTAEAGGRALPLVAVDGIHMAVRLPPATTAVSLRYRRPPLGGLGHRAPYATSR